MKVVNKTRPFEFQHCFFLCPKTRKDDIRDKRCKDFFRFLRTHCVANEVGFCGSDAFDIQTTRSIAEETPYSLFAMTYTKMDIWMAWQIWFTVFIIGKSWHFVDAKTLPKPSQQLNIANCTLLPALQLPVTQCLFLSPFRKGVDESHDLLFAEVGNMVVDVKHFYQFDVLYLSLCDGEVTNKSYNSKTFKHISLLYYLQRLLPCSKQLAS